MQISAVRRLAAPRAVVWAALNDAEVLRRSLPGCNSLEPAGDGAFAAVVSARIGPVRARFTGRIALDETDPPRRCRLTGSGDGGAAGFARGGAVVTLDADGDATLLRYDVEATVGGKLAQIGQRLIDAAARKMADDFFARFEALVAERAAPPPGPAEPEAAAAPGDGLPALVWAPALVVVAGLLLVLIV